MKYGKATKKADQGVVDWTDDQIEVQRHAIQHHLEEWDCADCLWKHSTVLQALLEEQILFTGDLYYLKEAQKVREFRKSLKSRGSKKQVCVMRGGKKICRVVRV